MLRPLSDNIFFGHPVGSGSIYGWSCKPSSSSSSKRWAGWREEKIDEDRRRKKEIVVTLFLCFPSLVSSSRVDRRKGLQKDMPRWKAPWDDWEPFDIAQILPSDTPFPARAKGQLWNIFSKNFVWGKKYLHRKCQPPKVSLNYMPCFSCVVFGQFVKDTSKGYVLCFYALFITILLWIL